MKGLPAVKKLQNRWILRQKKVESIEHAIRSTGSLSKTDITGSDLIWALDSIVPDSRTPAPEDEMEEAYERESLERLLEVIDKREATIIKLRYGLIDGKPKTLEEIGARLRISRERVRQIEKEVIKKLHYILTKEK